MKCPHQWFALWQPQGCPHFKMLDPLLLCLHWNYIVSIFDFDDFVSCNQHFKNWKTLINLMCICLLHLDHLFTTVLWGPSWCHVWLSNVKKLPLEGMTTVVILREKYETKDTTVVCRWCKLRTTLETMGYAAYTPEDIKFLENQIAGSCPDQPKLSDKECRNISIIAALNA